MLKKFEKVNIVPQNGKFRLYTVYGNPAGWRLQKGLVDNKSFPIDKFEFDNEAEAIKAGSKLNDYLVGWEKSGGK